ncbi:MAG: D-tyrosyl-tRNA(Tyr) deacylase, partial [Patiriisocius sp.]
MIGLIQRVKRAQVVVGNETISQIDSGILLLLGVEKKDTISSTQKLAKKMANLRIFPDSEG